MLLEQFGVMYLSQGQWRSFLDHTVFKKIIFDHTKLLTNTTPLTSFGVLLFSSKK